ncbi:pimeloyl-ACP methyl ester carboxylesterase [Crossiella equi]|uniref:Pimeloyl-ACP methyl ester carboxylesterase n=1 Tax=Crossiella equi TaxID=130796 RepID=A0ABS5A627_9PSEU|nr:alpha/beta fold hydrolase [Crossiella equi]MBP2472051.1 pimeloyl-ACP methyl ester carboxylesterase [Crossiella equi]
MSEHLSRRGVVKAAGLGALLLGLGRTEAAAAPAGPRLPPGFGRTFTSSFVVANGLRQHVVTGGDGPPLLLVHGWPQTWYAWRHVMPALAEEFRVVAVDQRGMGRTGKPRTGYDTATLATDLVALMEALGHGRFDVVGHDTGLAIGYALAADHPARVRRLAVAEAVLPGLSETPPVLTSPQATERLWHLMFNRLGPEVNEALVRGREEVYFGPKFTGLPREAAEHYVSVLRDPDNLRGSFGWYGRWT